MSKVLNQPVSTQSTASTISLSQEQLDPQSMEQEEMVRQSMLALESQEEYERSFELSSGNYDVSQSVNSMDVMANVQQDATSVDKSNVTNVISSVFHKLADVFGEDTSIGKTCEDWANSMDKSVQKLDTTVQTQNANNVNNNTLDNTANNKDVSKREVSADEEISNNNMRESAKTLVNQDAFLSTADAKDSSFKQLDSKISHMNKRLSENTMGSLCGVDASDEDRQNVAGSYMTMMRGLKEYNDTAVDAINERYADDDAKREKAMQGLGRVMQKSVEPTYANLAKDDKLYGFLSENDKQELNDMQFTGVNSTYNDVVLSKDSKTQDMTKDSQMTNSVMSNESLMPSRDYASITGSSNKSRQSDSKSRGEQAEARFDTILNNDRQARQDSLLAGLER